MDIGKRPVAPGMLREEPAAGDAGAASRWEADGK